MELEFILEMIEEGSYWGLFLWLWFGIFVLPIPNEVIVMTIALASSMDVLNPFFAFLVIYIGILFALTTSYSLGRFLGRPLLRLFEKRKKISRSIDKSIQLIEKYHAFSLLLSYFIPGVRIFVPFLYGTSRLSFKTFVLFAYFGALIWLAIFFTLGYLFGDNVERIMMYEREILVVMIVPAAGYAIVQILKRKKRRKKMKTAKH